MNSVVNNMPKYDHRQHVLSDWLAELDQRFQLGEVGEDRHKITWCQLLIGATGSSILSGLEDDASWETAKETLLSRLGIGSVKDEAWAALKNLKKGSKEIVELAGEAEKLAKRLHPRDEEAAERHAIDAFLGALERPLAAEVQKLGCRTLEDVVAAARRIEKVLEEQTDSKMERLISAMQDQIRLLKKDLKEAQDQITTPGFCHPNCCTRSLTRRHCSCRSPASSRSTASFGYRSTASSRSCSPLLPGLPRGRSILSATSPAARQATSSLLLMRRRRALCVPMPGSLSPTALTAPASERYRSLPSKRTSLGATSRGRWRPKLPSGAFKLLGGSPEAKVTPVGCAVGPPITGQLTLEGIPVLGFVDTGASVTCMGFSVWWQYRAQWGPLKPFGGVVHGAHGKPLQIAGKMQHLDLQWGEARGRACFIVIVGLESPPCLIGMDIMRPLHVRIDVTNGTATPAQPDPQTVHLNVAQQQKAAEPQRDIAPQPLPSPPQEIAPPPATPHTASRALLLQTADIPAETARLVRCHNPWPAEDVYFCPEDSSAGVCDRSSRTF